MTKLLTLTVSPLVRLALLKFIVAPLVDTSKSYDPAEAVDIRRPDSAVPATVTVPDAIAPRVRLAGVPETVPATELNVRVTRMPVIAVSGVAGTAFEDSTR